MAGALPSGRRVACCQPPLYTTHSTFPETSTWSKLGVPPLLPISYVRETDHSSKIRAPLQHIRFVEVGDCNRSTLYIPRLEPMRSLDQPPSTTQPRSQETFPYSGKSAASTQYSGLQFTLVQHSRPPCLLLGFKSHLETSSGRCCGEQK